MSMDEIEIDPGPRDDGQRAGARAVVDLLDHRSRAAAHGDPLADITARAGRHHRRRLAGTAALSVAAVSALALGGPAVLGATGALRAGLSTSVAALVPDEAQATGGGPSPLLDAEQVAAFAPGTAALGQPLVSQAPASPDTEAAGGFCGDTTLVGTTAPTQTWSATWQRGSDTETITARRVQERVLRWGDDADSGRHVINYAWAATDATTVCPSPSGQVEWDQLIASDPVEGPIAGAALAPAGARTAWRYRVIAPARDGRAIVELTVDVEATDAGAASSVVDPLLVAAVERASIAPTSGPGAVAKGQAEQVNGPAQWRAALSEGALLSPGQVTAVFHDAKPTSPPAALSQGDQVPQTVAAGCVGASTPSGIAAPASAWTASWSHGGTTRAGSSTVIGEEVYRWDTPAAAKAYLKAARDPARACGPADLADDGAAWEAVNLKVAGSSGTWWPAIARPAPGGRWTVRAARVDFSTAVMLTLTATADSPQDLADKLDSVSYDATIASISDQVVFP